MSFRRRALSGALTALVLTAGVVTAPRAEAAQGSTEIECATLPMTTTELTPVNATLKLPKFNPALGTLLSVDISDVQLQVTSSTVLTNNASNTTRFRFTSDMDWMLSLPSGDLTGDPFAMFNTGVAAISLASGASLPLGPYDQTTLLQVPSITGADVANYVGAGQTFDAVFQTFTSTSFVGGGGNVSNPQQTTAGGKICVTYTYEPIEPPIPPEIAVTKSVSPTTIPATGGSVTYTIVVSNPGAVDATISSLSDTMITTFPETCRVGTVLPARGSCTISYAVLLPAAAAGATAPNTVTVIATAGTLTTAPASAKATVTYVAVPPTSNSNPSTSTATTSTSTTTTPSGADDLPATGADTAPLLWLGGGLVGLGLLLVVFGRRRRA